MPSSPPRTPYRVYPFTLDDLSNALANDRLAPAEISRRRMTDYLFGYLKTLGAETIVVEYDYVDGDYLDDYAAYYVKCFYHYDRRCKRLHFFTRAIAEEDFSRLVLGEMDGGEDLQPHYLGFVVARPLPDAVVGRTVLKHYPPADGDRRHYPCTRDYTANLFGTELTVRSLAFQEQDTVLAACATVALWSAFNKTKDLFGMPSPTPAEITRSTSHLIHRSRPIPSHGLNVQQMLVAIRYVGLEPEVIKVTENEPLVSLVYAHLKMGLPVILAVYIEGVGHHAITLTGYSRKKTKVLTQEVAAGTDCAPMVGLHIDAFYAHDDQIGPFAHLYVRPSRIVATPSGNVTYPVTFDGTWLDKQTGVPRQIYPLLVIVPVYHKIRVTFQDVQKWVYRLHGLLSLQFPPGTDLEWDLHLTTINDYKKSVKRAGKITGGRLEEVLLKQNPKYIWRATLTLDGKELVEVLGDATDMARSFPIYQIIWFEDELREQVKKFISSSRIEQKLIEILTRPLYDFVRANTS